MKLKDVVDSYMQRVPEVRKYCQRCLRTERWDGNVVLMVVDAAFDSIGLNYFTAVVPKVDKFRRNFVEPGKVCQLEDLTYVTDEELQNVWQNRRSWRVARSIASYLSMLGRRRKLDDRQAFIYWAKHSVLESWQDDPIGCISGVGINTFQYLRMMGGVDTVMPDKIVRRVVGEMLARADIAMPDTDIGFIHLVEQIAEDTGYRATELCWMTWLIQSEANLSRSEKYAALLPKI